MKVLITMPDYDEATSYLYHFSKEIIDFAKQKGINVLCLSRPRLRRKNFEGIVFKQKPDFILFNAHGDPTTIYGDKIKDTEEYLIQQKKNHDLLEGRITYARACHAAASLGVACTKNSGCFIGYDTPFSFWHDENRATNPLKDKTAHLFLHPSNLIAISILKGKTVADAVNSFLVQSKKNIQKILKSKNEPGAMDMAMVLWSNMQGQRVLGNSSAVAE